MGKKRIIKYWARFEQVWRYKLQEYRPPKRLLWIIPIHGRWKTLGDTVFSHIAKEWAAEYNISIPKAN